MALSVLQMDIGGSEWIIIILMALFLLFGSKKLPEFSRAIGKASGEYEKTRELFRREMENAAETVEDPKRYFMLPKITAPVSSEREKLEVIASSLDIKYIGQTDEQLRLLILERIKVGAGHQ
ncbi:MAG TPA: twin-arginine translocase TatA/TatE family subunit [Nitrososphaeraceae archaeon]|nr:twin-arginine translocase TatA/TatE family subunit [Nitrososphaeraceae archaeon]